MYSVSTIIIAITALATFMGLSNVAFFDRFKFSISKIKSGEQFRMITSGFLHADWFHFAFNMFSFWSFANLNNQGQNVAGIAKAENIQLKTKPIQLETINLIANKLKERGLLTSQTVNMSLNSNSHFIPSTYSELQIIGIMEPLVNNGQQIQQELLMADANRREGEALGENAQSE